MCEGRGEEAALPAPNESMALLWLCKRADGGGGTRITSRSLKCRWNLGVSGYERNPPDYAAGDSE